jgi:DNA-binding MarR family transcriptional regulator
MADFKSIPGSFLPFLESSQQRAPSPPPSPASPLTLLDILGRQEQQSLPMYDLQTLSGMDPSRYRESLKSLRDTGYVEIGGDPLAEVVKLTDRGAEVSRLARPA